MAQPLLVRVFPRRTAYTPDDNLAFVGEPPMWRPPIERVLVSVTFTWDRAEGERLAESWRRFCRDVTIGGPAYGDPGGEFEPGLFIRQGITFTSRGCNNHCPWCPVPEREGKWRPIRITPGYVIQDNNFLQAPEPHRRAVYAMLRNERRGAVFAGGLDTRLITDEIAEELRGLRIGAVFLAADTDAALAPLERALPKLSFLGREKLRCYVLCGWNGETIAQARARLERVWELGAMPFAQLYQPPEGRKREYGAEWRELARLWSRPALMKLTHTREATQ